MSVLGRMTVGFMVHHQSHVPLFSVCFGYQGSHQFRRRENSLHYLMGSGKILEESVDLEIGLLATFGKYSLSRGQNGRIYSWMYGVRDHTQASRGRGRGRTAKAVWVEGWALRGKGRGGGRSLR